LPLQTSGAGFGQMNLQNPNSLDSLTINGVNNYAGVQNRNGVNNWGAVATITPALGYVPPTVIPPPFVPASVPPDAPIYFVSAPYLPPIPPLPASKIDTVYIAPSIQNSTNFVVYNQTQTSASVNVTMAPDMNAVSGAKTIAGMQAYDKDTLVPKSESGMVNILVRVLINGEPTTLAASSPVQGFKFTVPEALLPASIVSNSATLTASPSSGSLIERAVQSDGSPLPSWLKYDPETNTFSAAQVPQGAKALEIKIQTIKNGQILEESPPIIIDAK
jgi:hypothetical protein